MSKAEKTKQFIIEKTASLFNTKGYISTSISDITEATGLTKGSIYGNFENKDNVALEVYQYNASQVAAGISAAFGEKYPSVAEKLYAFVAFYRDNWPSISSKGGCALMNAATESDDAFPMLRNQVKKSFESWGKKICATIQSGQKACEIDKKADPEKYASLFITLIEGGILLSKITDDSKHLHLALDRATEIIEQELIKKQPDNHDR